MERNINIMATTFRFAVLLTSCVFHATALAPTPPDIVVVGAGSAGLTAAKFSARFGKSVLLVEKAKSGGDCTWTGCVPSKSLIAAAKAAHAATEGGEQHGVYTEGPARVSWEDVKARLERVIQRIYDADDSPEALKALNIDYVSAAASFVDSNTMLLQHEEYNETVSAKFGYVVATGARPFVPNIPGLGSAVPFVTYEEIFSLPKLPSKLTIIGGGPIGCELAQAFQRLGSEVTLIAPRLLPAEDVDASVVLERVFKSEGVRLVMDRVASVEASTADASSGASGHIAFTDSGEEVAGDVLLLATGREVVVDSLGLDNAGVEYSSKGISINDKLCTTSKKIYAAGDCTGGPQFTHIAGEKKSPPTGASSSSIAKPYSSLLPFTMPRLKVFRGP